MIGLPQERDLVDGARRRIRAMNVARVHDQRMDDGWPCGAQPLPQSILGIFIHEEANRPAVHAIDRLRGVHCPVESLEHETIPAKRDDDIRVLGRAVSVESDEPLESLVRLCRARREECDQLGAGRGPGDGKVHGALALGRRWKRPRPGAGREGVRIRFPWRCPASVARDARGSAARIRKRAPQ